MGHPFALRRFIRRTWRINIIGREVTMVILRICITALRSGDVRESGHVAKRSTGSGNGN